MISNGVVTPMQPWRVCAVFSADREREEVCCTQVCRVGQSARRLAERELSRLTNRTSPFSDSFLIVVSTSIESGGTVSWTESRIGFN